MKQSAVVRWTVVGLMAILLCIVTWQLRGAQAQGDPGGPPGPPLGAPGGQNPPNRWMGPPMPMASMTTHGEYLYVLQNNTLYQYSANDLRLIKRVQVDPARGGGPTIYGSGGGGPGGGFGGPPVPPGQP